MKKILCAVIMILCMAFMSGCAQKMDADTNTVFVDKKGKIISVDVEALDREYYDVEELEAYIENHLKEYTEANGETVEKMSFEVKDGKAKLKMSYDSWEDYTGFNGIEMYTGTVVKAQAEGYDFDTDFYSVADSGEQNTAGKEEVLSDDDSKVAIIKANVNIKVPGRVLFVSEKNTKVSESDTVSITGEGSNEEAELTYIIYK